MNKKELIEQIIQFPNKYSLLTGMNKGGTWDLERLEFLEISILKDILRDITQFEINNQKLKDAGY